MVKEALHERANLLQIAPHLAYPLPIMLPVYRYLQILWVHLQSKVHIFCHIRGNSRRHKADLLLLIQMVPRALLLGRD